MFFKQGSTQFLSGGAGSYGTAGAVALPSVLPLSHIPSGKGPDFRREQPLGEKSQRRLMNQQRSLDQLFNRGGALVNWRSTGDFKVGLILDTL